MSQHNPIQLTNIDLTPQWLKDIPDEPEDPIKKKFREKTEIIDALRKGIKEAALSYDERDEAEAKTNKMEDNWTPEEVIKWANDIKRGRGSICSVCWVPTCTIGPMISL